MIGEELRKLRKAKNLTQQQVEQICGIRQQSLTCIENNKTDPTCTTLFKLLSVYIDDVEHITDFFEIFKQFQDLKTKEKVKTKEEVFKELLDEYRIAEDINIGEFSLNVKRDRERLQEKIERYWQRWTEAE